MARAEWPADDGGRGGVPAVVVAPVPAVAASMRSVMAVMHVCPATGAM